MVVVKDVTSIQNELSFIDSLGYTGAELAEKSNFNAACYPKTNSIYVGYLNGHLILTAPDIAFENLNDAGNPFYDSLSKVFPDQEIASFHLQSSVNGYGFMISNSEEIIRERWGDYEIHMEDIGNPLPEEQAYYEKIKYDPETGMVAGSENEEEGLDFEELVSVVGSRYFGKSMLECGALWDLELSQYTYLTSPFDRSRGEKTDTGELETTAPEEKSFINRYWWVFILAYIIVKVIVRTSK